MYANPSCRAEGTCDPTGRGQQSRTLPQTHDMQGVSEWCKIRAAYIAAFIRLPPSRSQGAAQGLGTHPDEPARSGGVFHRFIEHNGTGERDLKATGELCARNPLPTRFGVRKEKFRNRSGQKLENLVLSDPETTLFYQNYNFEKTKKNRRNGFSRGVSRATEAVFFRRPLPHCPIPLGPTQ